jgi:serine/threonine protein kinase
LISSCRLGEHAGEYAIKVASLSGGTASREHTKSSFAREIEILRALPPHENIVQFIESLVTDETIGIVMEKMDESLDAILERSERDGGPVVFAFVEDDEVISMARMVASGLAHLHAHGIAHRECVVFVGDSFPLVCCSH